MSRIRKDGYTPDQIRYLTNHWATQTAVEIAAAIGRTESSVRTYAAKVLHLLKPSDFAQKNRARFKKRTDQQVWTDSEKQYLVDNWQTKTKREMAQELGRTPTAVKSMGQKEMGLKKSATAHKIICKRTCVGVFQKGHLPHNTITTGEEMPIRIRYGRKKRPDYPPYQWIRIAVGKWKQYHIWLWEQANGPVPEGHILIFRNKNTLDVRLENIELLTLEENAIRNSPSTNLTDAYVANTIARQDPDLKREVLKHSALLDIKRKSIQLNRLIKNG